MAVHGQVDRAVVVTEQAFAEVDEHRVALTVPSWIMNRSAPCAETAESMLSENRAPVAFTTGVRPTGAQVVPAW
jgi:hypothetical protein